MSNTVILCRKLWHITCVLWADRWRKMNCKKEKDKKTKKDVIMGSKRMRSGRSTIWADSPLYRCLNYCEAIFINFSPVFVKCYRKWKRRFKYTTLKNLEHLKILTAICKIFKKITCQLKSHRQVKTNDIISRRFGALMTPLSRVQMRIKLTNASSRVIIN